MVYPNTVRGPARVLVRVRVYSEVICTSQRVQGEASNRSSTRGSVYTVHCRGGLKGHALHPSRSLPLIGVLAMPPPPPSTRPLPPPVIPPPPRLPRYTLLISFTAGGWTRHCSAPHSTQTHTKTILKYIIHFVCISCSHVLRHNFKFYKNKFSL